MAAPKRPGAAVRAQEKPSPTGPGAEPAARPGPPPHPAARPGRPLGRWQQAPERRPEKDTEAPGKSCRPAQQPLQRDPSAGPSPATADHWPPHPSGPGRAPPPHRQHLKASCSPPSARGPGAPVLPCGDCRGQSSPCLFLRAPQARHSCPPTLEPTQQPTAWSTALPPRPGMATPCPGGRPSTGLRVCRAGGVGGS